MFYYPHVLNHRTGCFATIWLAATKGRKITRRDLLKVNIYRTCNDIMDYVLVKVPPLSAGLPCPRFSLYLSSQLQYGVVIIYHQQCQILLEEIHGAIDKLQRFSKRAQIDMLPEDGWLPHTIPDALSILNETEGARDPFFGDMEFGLPSPTSLIELAEQMRERSPELPLPPRGPTPPSDGITASQESITLTEQEPLVRPEPEFELADLQEIDMIDMLLEQSDRFPEGEEERGPEERQRERERERERESERERERERAREEAVERERERVAAEVERTRDLTGSILSAELVPTTEISRDVEFVPEVDLGLPVELPLVAERERTPEPEIIPIPPAPPTPQEEEWEERRREGVEPPPAVPEPPVQPKRRRRRRQLVFADEVTQIPQEELQAQIDDLFIETRPLEDVLIRPPAPRSDPAELLRNPCTDLPAPVRALWEEEAVLRPRLRRRWHREGALLELEPLPTREREREEPSPREIPRELLEPSISQYDTPVSSGILEITDRDVSPLVTPEIPRSPPTLPVHGLEDIPEERVPELEEILMEAEEPLGRLDEEGELTFHSLLPRVVSRRTVAHAFWRLLERIEAREVSVRQDVPYGDLFITHVHQPR